MRGITRVPGWSRDLAVRCRRFSPELKPETNQRRATPGASTVRGSSSTNEVLTIAPTGRSPPANSGSSAELPASVDRWRCEGRQPGPLAPPAHPAHGADAHDPLTGNHRADARAQPPPTARIGRAMSLPRCPIDQLPPRLEPHGVPTPSTHYLIRQTIQHTLSPPARPGRRRRSHVTPSRPTPRTPQTAARCRYLSLLVFPPPPRWKQTLPARAELARTELLD